jgi:adhesin transport system membrane fusion protein
MKTDLQRMRPIREDLGMVPLQHGSTDRWLNLPLELRDDGGARNARLVTAIIIVLLSALLAWAAVAPIDEAAIASGQIMPASPISDVHHLEGGIVDRVLVKEGDRVRQRQVLVTLRPEQTESDFLQLDARLAAFRLKSMRLAASLAEQPPDFGPLGERFPRLRSEQMLAFSQDAAHTTEERQRIQLTIERASDQLATAREEAKSLATQVDLQSRLAAIRQKSQELGYTALPLALQARTSLEEAKHRLITANGRITELTRLRDEAQSKLRETIAERRSKLATELADTGGQLGETQAAMEKHEDRMRRLEVRAPIDGTVYTLASDVNGEVVKAGALVAQIVPGAGGIVAVVEVDPREAGHVHVGDEAEIRMSNYDPNVTGVVKGEVEQISAMTFLAKDGRPFYRVQIALNRDHVFAERREFPLLPGMTLQAQIKTGSKTLLRYMLKPIYQSLNAAFAER